MDKKDFEDLTKAIELTRGEKPRITYDVSEFFTKYAEPLRKEIIKIAKKDEDKAFNILLTISVTHMAILSKKARILFLETLKDTAEQIPDIREQSKIGLDLLKRLKEERKAEGKK